MATIKFSHRYKKMPHGVEYLETFVEDVSFVHYRDLTADEILKDTETVDGQFYQLPKTYLIRIRLWTPCYDMETRESVAWKWTTMRPYTPEEFEYYKKLIGQQVGILIERQEAKGGEHSGKTSV